jgi:hypothetical protein
MGSCGIRYLNFVVPNLIPWKSDSGWPRTIAAEFRHSGQRSSHSTMALHLAAAAIASAGVIASGILKPQAAQVSQAFSFPKPGAEQVIMLLFSVADPNIWTYISGWGTLWGFRPVVESSPNHIGDIYNVSYVDVIGEYFL